MPGGADIAQLLRRLPEAPDEVSSELFDAVYDRPRQMAEQAFRGERDDHTLQPTALVHEAYLRVVNQSEVTLEDRNHFLNFAAMVMRRVLVDHARRRGAEIRGGDMERVTFDPAIGAADASPDELLDLDAALTKLAERSERVAKLAELRFFAGLTLRECGEVLGRSSTTIDDDWAIAHAWLKRELTGQPED